MSYFVEAFTVDFDAIAALLGGADPIACGAILDAAEENLADADRRSGVAGGTTAAALVEILTSKPARLLARHGYALRSWIESSEHSPTSYLGGSLCHPNDGWSSMRMEWFDDVSRALRRAGHTGLPGLPLRSGLPFAFDLHSEWPAISHLPRAQCAGFRDGLDAALAAPGWDPATAASVHLLRRWVADAALWEMDLVAFYS